MFEVITKEYVESGKRYTIIGISTGGSFASGVIFKRWGKLSVAGQSTVAYEPSVFAEVESEGKKRESRGYSLTTHRSDDVEKSQQALQNHLYKINELEPKHVEKIFNLISELETTSAVKFFDKSVEIDIPVPEPAIKEAERVEHYGTDNWGSW